MHIRTYSATDGVLTSCGSKMLANFIPRYDAHVTARLNDHSMPMLGKTNMDEFAMGSSTETSYFGACRNPWDLTKVAGGSSGGSAAAVGGRLCPAATGSDTGGSIRQPAAFCGLTGIKPTYGTISRFGMVAYASSLDQAGVMAASALDCALLLEVLAGFDPMDSTSAEHPAPRYSTLAQRAVSGMRIGLPKEYYANITSAGVTEALQAAVTVLQSLGCQIVEVDLPSTELSIPAYYTIALAECSSNLARFDGIRFGHRCQTFSDLEDYYLRTRSEGFGAEVKRRILTGTYVISAGYYDAYYLKALKARRLIADEFSGAFQKVDVLLSPVTPDTAFSIGEKVKDPLAMYQSDIFTVGVNLAGLPAMSLPAGFNASLPIGMQLIGKKFDEGSLLALAHSFQGSTDWHARIPEALAEGRENFASLPSADKKQHE